MRFWSCVVTCFFIVIAPGLTSAEEPFPYPPGEKQVVFGFSGWRVSSYEGGLGLRFFHSRRLASLFMIDLTLSSRSEDMEGYDDVEMDDQSNVGVGVSGMLEKYLPTFHSIAPCVGLGAGYSYNRHEYENVYEKDGESRTSTRTTSGHRVNVRATLGVEWAFTHGISLGARYNIKLDREWISTEREHRGVPRTYKTDIWLLATGAGHLTASIRF